jgi:CelD/BcsL family acetyltransferase involved in cellulose biosynthesis
VSGLEPIADLASARPLWERLAAASGNVFATWEWADTWWEHFGGAGELSLHACRRAGEAEPFAILPLHRTRLGPLPLLRFLGHGVGDVLGPVCAPADAAAAGAALLAALRAGALPAKLLVAERMPSGPGADALGGPTLAGERNPSLDVEGRTWDEYLRTTSKNMREKVRRSTKKAERDHELTYELCESPERVEPMMRALFDLHARRWGERAGAFGSAANVGFHLDFAARAQRHGWLRLWEMRIDGEPAAAWYGFRFGGVEAYYQSGRDPRWDRFSVGFLMLVRSIRAAFDDGLDSYGFLRGDESYKDRFATTVRTIETRAVGRGPVARGVVAGGASAARVPAVRKRLASIAN